MKNSLGLVYKRREKILDILKKQKKVLVKDLSNELGVSEITIRRDLQILEDENIIDRFYGGARLKNHALMTTDMLSTNQNEENTLDEDNENIKYKLALQASKMVQDGDTIFINSGSTAFQLINILLPRRVTIITNNGKVINHSGKSEAEIVISGGEIYPEKQSLVGDFAINTFSKVSANICFLSVGGITKDTITTFVLSETPVNRTILERTNGPRVILASGDKVGKENNFITSEVSLITHLITDSSADKNELNLIKKKGVEVIVVD